MTIPRSASPLRWQTSSSSGPARQKGSMSDAACGRLRHLQTVATWASAQVPPLGAFLGSRLASTSQLLGCPPPPSPHFTCQRCESILQVGINCSVRIRSNRRTKQSKEACPPINCILYYCHYCAFDNMKLGTSKAYVKTKLSELADARNKLSEVKKGLGEKTTKSSNKDLMSTTKVISTESAGSSGKKTKRKGWLSLKQLAASSAGLSPICSRPSTVSTLTPLPRIKNLDSSALMPKFSRVGLKDVTHASNLKEECPLDVNNIEINLALEQCNTSAGDIGSKETSNSVKLQQNPVTPAEQSSMTNVVCLSAWPHQQERGPFDLSGEMACSSRCEVECVHSIYNIGGQGAVKMEVEKMEQPSKFQSDANAIVLDQLSADHSVSKHDELTHAALGNFSNAVLPMKMANLSPTSSTQGVMIRKYATSRSSSASKHRNGSTPDIITDSVAFKTLQSPSKKEGVLMSGKDVVLNLSIVKSASLPCRIEDGFNKLENRSDKGWQSLSKKRELDDCDSLQKFAKKQKSMAISVLDANVDIKRGKVTSDIVWGREVQSKTKPLFRRMGRHWFTKCRSRTIKWRLI